MRMFSTPEGDAGFALKGDDIVSVFKHPSAPYRNVTKSMLDLATSQGGRRLDAFDTVLPKIYSQSGFRAVARLPFNDQYAPEGWDREHFKAFNGGRPDVVFMAHDPQAGLYSPWDAKRISDYDEGETHQRAALAEIDRRGNVPAEPGPGAYGSGQLIRMRDPTTVWHGTPHTFQPTRAGPLGEFDIGKMGTGEGAQVYGRGIYQAGHEQTATEYRDALSEGQVYYQGKPMLPEGQGGPAAEAQRAVADLLLEAYTPEGAIEAARRSWGQALFGAEHLARQKPTYVNKKRVGEYHALITALNQLDTDGWEVKNEGNLYQGELHIHHDHLLDWDKPFNQQSPYIQDRLTKMQMYPAQPDKHQPTGAEIHSDLAYGDTDRDAAAKELLANGIPGIRYLDQDSRRRSATAKQDIAQFERMIAERYRQADELQEEMEMNQGNPGLLPHYFHSRQASIDNHHADINAMRERIERLRSGADLTHNYVVFDPRTVNIVRRNGLPAMVAAGADALRDHKRSTP